MIECLEFERQEVGLTQRDVHAIISCMLQLKEDGALRQLAFFNAGRKSGASQPHKHAQIIPIDHEDGSPLFRFLKQHAIINNLQGTCLIFI